MFRQSGQHKPFVLQLNLGKQIVRVGKTFLDMMYRELLTPLAFWVLGVCRLGLCGLGLSLLKTLQEQHSSKVEDLERDGQVVVLFVIILAFTFGLLCPIVSKRVR